MSGQDSDGGGEAQRKCVRCMQGVCGGFGTRRPSNQESFSKMFLNTSSRVIRLRLILSHLRGPRPAGCLVASSPGRNLLLLLGLVAVGRVVSEALILWTLETGLALALAPAAARPLGLPTDRGRFLIYFCGLTWRE